MLGLAAAQAAQQEGNSEAAKIARDAAQAVKDQDWNKAIDGFRKAAEMDRKYSANLAAAYQQRAFVYANEQRFQDSLNDLAESLRIKPGDAHAFEIRHFDSARIANDYVFNIAFAIDQRANLSSRFVRKLA